MLQLTKIIEDNDIENLRIYMQKHAEETHKYYYHLNEYDKNDPVIAGMKCNNEAYYLFLNFIDLQSPKDIQFSYYPHFRNIDLLDIAVIQGNLDFYIHCLINNEVQLTGKHLTLSAFTQPLSFTQSLFESAQKIHDIKIPESVFIQNMLHYMLKQQQENNNISPYLEENFFFYKEEFKNEYKMSTVLSSVFSLHENITFIIPKTKAERDRFFTHTVDMNMHECFLIMSHNSKFKPSIHNFMYEIFDKNEIKDIYSQFFNSLHTLDEYLIYDQLDNLCSNAFKNLLENHPDIKHFLCEETKFFDMRYFDNNYLSECRDNMTLSVHYQKIKLKQDIEQSDLNFSLNTNKHRL